MRVLAPATPSWQLAQFCAEAALCLVLGAALFGCPGDRALLAAAAGLLAGCGVIVIIAAALGALVVACRSRWSGSVGRLPPAPPAKAD